jgi:phenylacetic acid degradation operon negative regulatory protein
LLQNIAGHDHIRNILVVDAPSPRSLILELLSTLRRGTMPVAALLAAGEVFGLASGSLRVALARLLASGRVERDERGRYRLGPAAAPMQGAVGRWRSLDAQVVAWDGTWWGIHATASPPRSARRGHQQALRLHGFRPLTRELLLRPANLVGGIESLRERLSALGLAPGTLSFALTDLDPEADTRARALWDASALRRGYRDSQAELAASAERLPGLPQKEAMRESFLLGGRVLQQLVLDPLLPAEILDPGERHALVDAMRDYDRLGRTAWAGLLARFGVPHIATPADSGFADRIARRSAA